MNPWRLGLAGAALCCAVAWAAGGDQDGDGIPDKDDDCPTLSGPKPTGCPKPDRDKDGLWDGVDSCPNQAEDPNGFKDGDGCPDDPVFREGDGVVQMRRPLVWDARKTRPPRRAREVARAAARWVKADPRVSKAEVVVYVDLKEGPRRQAEVAATERADALAALLKAAGLTPEQVTTRTETPPGKGGPAPRSGEVRLLLQPPPAATGSDGGAAVATSTDGGPADAASTPKPEQKPDAGKSATPQTPPDAGKAAKPQPPPDAGKPAKPQAPPDAGKPATPQAPPDAGTPAKPQAPADAGKPAKPQPPDAGKPAGPDTPADAGTAAKAGPQPDAGKATATGSQADAGAGTHADSEDWDREVVPDNADNKGKKKRGGKKKKGRGKRKRR